MTRPSARKPRGVLSPREREVLELVRRGLTQAAIAGELGISDRTVEAHLARIRVKYGVTTTAAAAAIRARGRAASA